MVADLCQNSVGDDCDTVTHTITGALSKEKSNHVPLHSIVLHLSTRNLVMGV